MRVEGEFAEYEASTFHKDEEDEDYDDELGWTHSSNTTDHRVKPTASWFRFLAIASPFSGRSQRMQWSSYYDKKLLNLLLIFAAPVVLGGAPGSGRVRCGGGVRPGAARTF